MSTTQAERPGRYTRSFGGLIVALAVTVVVLGLVLWVMSLFREDLQVTQQEIDYLDSVAGAQDAGLRPVYPERLPEGWIATGADVPPEDQRGFQLRFLNEDGSFVGIQQSPDESAEGLVEARVDEQAVEGEAYEAARGALAQDWRTFTDDGGDTAYVTDLGQLALIVYGEAPAADLEQLIALLTRAPVRD